MGNVIGLDKNPTVCHTGSQHHFDVTALHDGVDHVRELLVHLKYEEKREVTCRVKWQMYTISVCPPCNYIVDSSSCTCFEIIWRTNLWLN